MEVADFLGDCTSMLLFFRDIRGFEVQAAHQHRYTSMQDRQER
jgi:hypothetical protein